jgi:hypothetical protein
LNTARQVMDRALTDAAAISAWRMPDDLSS